MNKLITLSAFTAATFGAFAQTNLLADLVEDEPEAAVSLTRFRMRYTLISAVSVLALPKSLVYLA